MRVRTDLHTNTIFPANAGNPSISTVRSDGFVFWRGEMATWLSSHKWRDKHWRDFWLNESQWQSCWVSFSFFWASLSVFMTDWSFTIIPSLQSQVKRGYALVCHEAEAQALTKRAQRSNRSLGKNHKVFLQTYYTNDSVSVLSANV